MNAESSGERLTEEGHQSLCDGLRRGLEEASAVLGQLDDPRSRGHVAHLSLVSDNFLADAHDEHGSCERRESSPQLMRVLRGRGRRRCRLSSIAQSVRERGSGDLWCRVPPAVRHRPTPRLEQMAPVRGRGKRFWNHGIRGLWNWRRYQHQTPHLCRASRSQLRGNHGAVPVAQDIDLTQPHRIQKITDGGRMLGYTGRCRR